MRHFMELFLVNLSGIFFEQIIVIMRFFCYLLFSASFLFFAAIRFYCRSFRTFFGEIRTVVRYGFWAMKILTLNSIWKKITENFIKMQ